MHEEYMSGGASTIGQYFLLAEDGLHAGWLIPSEVHDLHTRSAGQSITVFTQLLSGAIVTQVLCFKHGNLR